MEKNVKLVYCILGGLVLTLLNHPLLSYAKLGMFKSGYGENIFGVLLVSITDLLSLVGFFIDFIFCYINNKKHGF